MFEHYSLRDVLAAFRAVKALAAKAGRAVAPMPLPASLQGNRGSRKQRRGMSAKSPYSRWRSQWWGVRRNRPKFYEARGAGSYEEASPQQLINKRRREADSVKAWWGEYVGRRRGLRGKTALVRPHTNPKMVRAQFDDRALRESGFWWPFHGADFVPVAEDTGAVQSKL